MARISQQTIQSITAHCDLVELASSRIQLKKRGQQHWACCPFHDEKTASFSIHEEKQFFYCFGCGAKGNVIDFVMQYDRLDFVEAMQMLSDQTGITLDIEQTNQRPSNNKPIYACLAAVTLYFQQQLRSHQSVINYLKERGLSGQTAKRYGLGYAPSDRTALPQIISAPQQDFIDAGLVKITNYSKTETQSPQTYNLFNQRVIFPIRDLRARVIAFGGRTLNASQQPKYLNSPETAVFHKGREIYGLYEALQVNRSLNYAILVEGYMDVIMLAQEGENKAVATLGTAVSELHFNKLFRHTDHIICCFDGDRAGVQASWKALLSVLPLMHAGRCVSFIHLAANHDPDSFITEHKLSGWNKQVAQAEPLSSFFFRKLQLEHGLKHLDDKAKFAHVASELLRSLPTGLYKNLLLKQLSDLTNISSQQLSMLKSKPTFKANQPLACKLALSHESGNQLSWIERALALLIHQPKLAQDLTDTSWLKQLTSPSATALLKVIVLCQSNYSPTLGSMIALCQQEADFKENLVKASFAYQELSLDAREEEFSHIIQKLKANFHQQEISDLMQLAKGNKLSPEQKNQLQKLIRQKNNQDVAQ